MMKQDHFKCLKYIVLVFLCAFLFETEAAYSENSLEPETVKRPFAEYNPVGLLFLSAKPYYSAELQEKILANLPKNVTVALYSDNQEDLIFAEELWGVLYKGLDIKYVLTPPSIRTPKGISYFAVDGMPYPVMIGRGTSQMKNFSLIDSQYQGGFEPDTMVSSITGMPRVTFPYVFEYGNFIANDKGLCIIISRPKEEIFSDASLKETFGCERLIRLPRLKAENIAGELVNKGLGHADERVKFVNADTVLTDSEEYRKILEEAGIKSVVLVPDAATPEHLFRTYINARLINGTAFVPVYGTPDDQKALDIYKNSGFNVVPVESVLLSDFGKGSVHCATATYPPQPDGIKLNFYTN